MPLSAVYRCDGMILRAFGTVELVDTCLTARDMLPAMTLFTSLLHHRHQQLGAKFAPFAGWEMPLEYTGVIAEHTAVRERVGVFDVSHLGKVRISGPGAAAFVNRCFTNDIDRIEGGKAQYTLCCTETGGVVDDLIIYRLSDDEVLAVPNAANAATVAELLNTAAPSDVVVTDEHHDWAVLAVQGPESLQLLRRAGFDADLPYMGFTLVDDVVVCRTGYTGEVGFELLVPAGRADDVFSALLAGKPQLCGLGARDTLRLEMGYPLHGQDLSTEITPVQAGLSWAVGWRKPEFWGREALTAEKAAGPERRLVGLVATERGIPRAGMSVLVDGEGVGLVTSGGFSPTRKIGIALALVGASAVTAAEFSVSVRGRDLRMNRSELPFVATAPYRASAG